MRSDVDRWNAKYAQREPATSIEPDPLLVQHRGLLGDSGLCVDIAGGTGDNGLYLAALGYDALIVDASETGLRLCRHKAWANGLDPMLVAADLDRFVLPPDTFDAVLVFRYLNRDLVDPIRLSLRPGGLLFFKTFNHRHLDKHPGFPREYVLDDGELTTWFDALDCVATNDGESPDTTYYWVGTRLAGPHIAPG